MSYHHGWPRYVPVAERRRRALRSVQKLCRQGQMLSPVVIQGRAIATTFWGKAWCENLESYRDYENRLPRGRSYARNGSVLDLQIAPTEVAALVSGSSLYTVRISIAGIGKRGWAGICRDCAGGIDSLVELLQGHLSSRVMERMCRQEAGLFPKPAEIRFSCSCPDYAAMCKHVAAVLYGVGARLDTEPELLFRLRDVDAKELLASAEATPSAAGRAPAPERALKGEDLSRLFGLDIDPSDGAVKRPTGEPALRKRARDRGIADAKPPRATRKPGKHRHSEATAPEKTAQEAPPAGGTTVRKRNSRQSRAGTSGGKRRPRKGEINRWS